MSRPRTKPLRRGRIASEKPERDLALAKRVFVDGIEQKEAAKEFGISHQRASQILAEPDIEKERTAWQREMQRSRRSYGPLALAAERKLLTEAEPRTLINFIRTTGLDEGPSTELNIEHLELRGTPEILALVEKLQRPMGADDDGGEPTEPSPASGPEKADPE